MPLADMTPPFRRLETAAARFDPVACALGVAAAGALLVVGLGLRHLHGPSPNEETEVVLVAAQGGQGPIRRVDPAWEISRGPEGRLWLLRDVEDRAWIWVRYEGRGVWGSLLHESGEGRYLVPGKRLALEADGAQRMAVVLSSEPGGRLEALRAGTWREPLPWPPLGWIAVATALAAVALLLGMAFVRGRPPRARELLCAWMLLACAGCFLLAWSWHAEVRLDGAEPDHVSYHEIVVGMDHPLDTGHREPLWPWVLRLWWLVAPNTVLAERFLGVLLAPLAVPATALLAWELFRSRLAAALAAGFIALQGLPAHMAPMGLRTPIYLALFAVTLALARRPRTRRRWIALGIAAGLLCLTRMESLGVVVLGLPAAWYLARPRWRWVAEGALGFALLTAPMFLGHLVQHGDPLYPLSRHARFYANEEPSVFGGEPGVEPAKGTFDYLVRVVGPARVVVRWCEGFTNLFLNPTALQFRMLTGTVDRPWAAWGLWMLLAAGWIAWAAGRHRAGLLLVPGALHGLPYLAAGIAEPRIFAQLLCLHAAAFAALGPLEVRSVLPWIARHFGRRITGYTSSPSQ